MPKAFVSSTFLDLEQHRAHVIEQLRRAGIHVDPMEDWPAGSDEPKKFSRDRLEGCQLCVLIVARRRGFVPDGETMSITQLEYEAAFAAGIYMIVYVLDEKSPWYPDYDELKSDPLMRPWRKLLGDRHGVESFRLEPESIQLTGALGRYFQQAQGKSASAPPHNWASKHLKDLHDELAFVAVPFAQPNRPRVLSLQNVYVPLKLRMQQDTADASDASWVSLLRRERVALTGDAGSGKSTLLRYLALQAAQRMQRRSEAQTEASGSAPVDDAAQAAGESLRIPIFLDLAACSSELLQPPGEGVVASVLPERWLPVLARKLRLTEAQATALLDQGNILLLLDGLDEVPSPVDREILVASIVAMQRRFSPLHAQNHVIVACREPAWGTSEAFARFHRILIQPMDRATILEYLSKWTHQVWGNEAEEIFGSLERSLGSPAFGDIASNPQMSTLLALVEYDENTPRQQALLFEYFVDKLSRSGARTAEQQKLLRSHLIALALEMQRSTNETGEPLNAIRVQKAEQLLAKRLRGSLSLNEARERGAALLTQLEITTGLIVIERLEGLAQNRALVRFKHRTFQEYLAACHYALEALDELLEHVIDPAWSKVLALACGILTQIDESAVRDFLERVLQTPQTSNGDALAAATLIDWAPRVAAASVCLAELASYDLDPDTLAPARRAHDLILPLFATETTQVDIQTRVRIAEGFGSIFDPRLARESRWVNVPAGPFVRGSELEEAWIQERPRSEATLDEFAIQRWPVTVAEYRRFLEEARGYTSDEWWTAEGRNWRDTNSIRAPAGWQLIRSRGNRPVTGVCYWEAQAFSRWWATVDAMLPDEWTIDLPTEAQWEKAARGPLAQHVLATVEKRFPWGDAWDDGLANCSHTGLQNVVPVGLFPAGYSEPYRLWDMAGNISEHCRDGFAQYGSTGDVCADYTHGHVLRGGSFASPPLDLRITYRFGAARECQDERVGFRCVAVPIAQQQGAR